jgi:hypothetical protein
MKLCWSFIFLRNCLSKAIEKMLSLSATLKSHQSHDRKSWSGRQTYYTEGRKEKIFPFPSLALKVQICDSRYVSEFSTTVENT